MLDGDVSIRIGDYSLSGWQGVQVHQSCESIPNHFTVTAADMGGALSASAIPAGAPCTILFGEDTALTGYVDEVPV